MGLDLGEGCQAQRKWGKRAGKGGTVRQKVKVRARKETETRP